MKTLIYTLLVTILTFGSGIAAAEAPLRLAGAHTDKGAQQADGERGGKAREEREDEDEDGDNGKDKDKGDKAQKRDVSCGKDKGDCEPGERGKKKGHEQGKGMDMDKNKGKKKGHEKGKGNQN